MTIFLLRADESVPLWGPLSTRVRRSITARRSAGVAELVDALGLGSSEQSWGFESLRPHHTRGPPQAAPCPVAQRSTDLSNKAGCHADHRNPRRGPEAPVQGRRAAGDLAPPRRRVGVAPEACQHSPVSAPGRCRSSISAAFTAKSVMADVLQNAVNEVNRKIVDEHKLKLAFEPAVNFRRSRTRSKRSWRRAATSSTRSPSRCCRRSRSPPFRHRAERRSWRCRRRTSTPRSHAWPSRRRPFADKGAKAKAESGDRVTVDFVGRIGGVEFEGGKGEDIQVVLGSNTFIPGFETSCSA